jgi:hypothetical protein
MINISALVQSVGILIYLIYFEKTLLVRKSSEVARLIIFGADMEISAWMQTYRAKFG